MSQFGFYPVTATEIETFWPASNDVEKLYFYTLKAEFNYAGSDNFRRSDAWFAGAIGCSVSAIRQARRGLQSKGMLDYEPGWRRGGRSLAGLYKTVSGVKVDEGIFWAQVGFYKLHMLVNHLRQKKLTRESVVLMILLDFYRWKFQLTHEDNFFLQKHEIRTAIRSDDVFKTISILHDGFKYSTEAHLFEYSTEYHRIKFSKFGDPSETGNCWALWRGNIKSAAAKLDLPKPKPKTKPKAK